MSATDDDDLGSLAQSSRKTELKKARTTMYVIGVLTLVVNLGLAFFAQNLVDSQFNEERQKLEQQGLQIDQQQFDEIKAQSITATRIAAFGFAAVGVAFLLIGVFIEAAPVPLTVLGLVLYIGGAAISAIADPSTLMKGLIIKIIIVVALVRAVQAALAYQREAEME